MSSTGIYYQGFNINLEKLLIYIRARIPKEESTLISEIDTMLILIPQNIFVPLKRFYKHVFVEYREEIMAENESFFLGADYAIDSSIVSILKQTYKNMKNEDKGFVKKKIKALVNCIDKLIAYDSNHELL